VSAQAARKHAPQRTHLAQRRDSSPPPAHASPPFVAGCTTTRARRCVHDAAHAVHADHAPHAQSKRSAPAD
jgi:hypothetical protein